MSLVAVKKRKSGKNRKDRNKVDRKVRRQESFQSAFSALHRAVDQFYGTPRLPYNVYILFVMYKGHFVMYKFNLLCAKCISL